MAQSQIRGTTQILDGTIPATKLSSGLNLATNQLAEGALFIKSNGLVSMGADLNMGGFKITNGAAPLNPGDFAIKSYVDGLVNGLTIHPFCRVVAVANSALTGLLTIDSVVLIAGDRVLLTAQTTGAQNGPWVASAGAWTRPIDWAAASVQNAGGYFIIEPDGTVYKNTKWFCTNANAVTVDTTTSTFTQDLSGTTYSNGNGLSLTGTIFAVKNGNGIGFDGSQNVTLVINGASLNLSASGIKISDGTPGQVMLGTTTTGAAVFTSLTGDVSVTGAGVTVVNNVSGSGFTKFGNFVFNETPTGAVNGVNTTYTLANTPVAGTVMVFINGQLQEAGAGNDYTITGTGITMLYTLIASDKIRTFYQK